MEATTPGAPSGRRRFRASLRPVTLAMLASVSFVFFYNDNFWARILEHHAPDTRMFLLLAGTAMLVAGLHFAVFAVVMNRWTAKPLLAVLIVTTAAAAYFMTRYNVFIDSAMVRNVLATDFREVRDLLSPGMALYMGVYAGLPLLLLSRIDVLAEPVRTRWWIMPAAVGAGLAIAAGGLLMTSQQLVPQLREHREMRYLVTPGNYIASLAHLVVGNNRRRGESLLPVGTDAVKVATGAKPVVLVIVVGETVRAQNWGLDGYIRQTTPQLAERNVINYQSVTACGTSTEVSLPCMFSAYGRHGYDESAIRGSESLLHVAARAGVHVLWRDNQSGCKGVCEGLESQSMRDVPGVSGCTSEGCLDETLLFGLKERIEQVKADQLIVLHQMGNHGPAYYRRYPSAFRRYTPECQTNELWKCTDQQIVNSYDNAILYTDDFLAKTIDLLQGVSADYRTAMIYVSDHGESLGEQGLYLHGIPRAIAPETQTHVPMVMWVSSGFAGAAHGAESCLAAHDGDALSHDNLFSTALGMLDVRTSVHDRHYDLYAGCGKS